MDLDPFGIVGRLSPRMMKVDRGGDRPREWSILGVDMGHPIVSNGDFMAY